MYLVYLKAVVYQMPPVYLNMASVVGYAVYCPTYNPTEAERWTEVAFGQVAAEVEGLRAGAPTGRPSSSPLLPK